MRHDSPSSRLDDAIKAIYLFDDDIYQEENAMVLRDRRQERREERLEDRSGRITFSFEDFMSIAVALDMISR